MKFTKYYDDDDDDDYLPTEEEHENDENLMIPSKILLDGCASMQHIIDRVRKYLEYFFKIQRDGWELAKSILADYGICKNK